jgi:hypothetical protein
MPFICTKQLACPIHVTCTRSRGGLPRRLASSGSFGNSFEMSRLPLNTAEPSDMNRVRNENIANGDGSANAPLCHGFRNGADLATLADSDRVSS